MVRVCESNVIFSVHSSVCLSSVHLSVMISPLKPLGGIQPNLLHHFPHGKGGREQHSFSARPSVYLSVTSISVTHLLNHWAEFYQTCFITSPHGKGMREQHYFIHAPVVHASVTLFPLKPLGGIQPNLLHHFPSW